MTLEADYANAIKRAEMKRRIAEILQTLPASDRRGVLLDLLAEGSSAQVEERKGEASGPSARDGVKPRVAGRFEGTGKIDALLGALKTRPRMPIAELATKVYGSDPKGPTKTRALLFNLKKKGRVRSPSHGQWEVA